MRESKKDMLEHKYGRVSRFHRALKEVSIDEANKLYDDAGLNWHGGFPEFCRYLRYHGISCHSRCNIKHDRQRRIAGGRKLIQIYKQKCIDKADRSSKFNKDLV